MLQFQWLVSLRSLYLLNCFKSKTPESLQKFVSYEQIDIVTLRLKGWCEFHGGPYTYNDNASTYIHIRYYVYVVSSCTTCNISKPSYSLSSKTRPQRHWACLASASIFSTLAITPFSPSVNIPGGNISSWPIWELQSDSSSATFGSCNFSDMSWLDSMVFQYISSESK